MLGWQWKKKPENLALGAREYQSPTLPEKAIVSSTEMLIDKTPLFQNPLVTLVLIYYTISEIIDIEHSSPEEFLGAQIVSLKTSS